MRVSQILTRVRDRIDEATANVFSDEELVRYLHESEMDMFRIQIQHDESYQNCIHDIVGATGIEQSSDIIVHNLPRWLFKLNLVHLTADSGIRRENLIPYGTLQRTRGPYWAWFGNHSIKHVGNHAGEDITVECGKRPAKLNSGSVAASPAPTSTTFHIEHDAVTTLYEMETEPDVYKNAEFEFTGVNLDAHTISSQIVRCDSSELVFDSSKTFTKITTDQAMTFTPNAADTWEMQSEMDASHIGLLILLTVEKAYQRKGNWEAISTMQPNLSVERLRYIEAMVPRNNGGLQYAGMDQDFLFSRDDDRDWGW